MTKEKTTPKPLSEVFLEALRAFGDVECVRDSLGITWSSYQRLKKVTPNFYRDQADALKEYQARKIAEKSRILDCVLAAKLKGLSATEIAKGLHITVHDVENHVNKIPGYNSYIPQVEEARQKLAGLSPGQREEIVRTVEFPNFYPSAPKVSGAIPSAIQVGPSQVIQSGLGPDAAARTTDLNYDVYNQLMKNDPAFNTAVEKAIENSHSRTPPEESNGNGEQSKSKAPAKAKVKRPFREDNKRTRAAKSMVLHHLQNGDPMAIAAGKLGFKERDLMRWRENDPVYDEQVAIAIQAGRDRRSLYHTNTRENALSLSPQERQARIKQRLAERTKVDEELARRDSPARSPRTR